MSRPRNQVQRRAELVTAAAQAVLRHGAADMRLLDIAQEAGLSSASVLYYYPDVRDLFTAVFEKGSISYCLHREERVAEVSDPVEKLFRCIRSGIPWPGESDEASRILYELMPVVLRHPQASAQYQSFIARQTDLYKQILDEGERSGVFRPALPSALLARSFVALEDGYGPDVLSGAVAPEEEENWLRAYAAAMTGLDLPAAPAA